MYAEATGSTKRWMIVGAGGMLSTDLRQELKDRDVPVIAVGIEELDITDRDAVLYLAKQISPDVIVNCAAYTKVDDCETHEEEATLVNGTAVDYLAEAANRWESLLVQISTDFVFNGSSTQPYEVNEKPAPLSAYGRSKLAGEIAAAKATKHQIIRTSWLFGRAGWNFVEAIRKQVLSGNKALRVVDDQRGKPTYTPHLADAIFRLGLRAFDDERALGIYHYADEEECTWYDFAVAIVEEMIERGEAEPDVLVHPTTTAQFPRPAKRPAYSVLSTERYERITGVRARSWREGLTAYFDAGVGV